MFRRVSSSKGTPFKDLNAFWENPRPIRGFRNHQSHHPKNRATYFLERGSHSEVFLIMEEAPK